MENKEIKDELKRQTNDAYSDCHSEIKLDKALKNERDARDGLALELDDVQRETKKLQNVIDIYESLAMDI